MIAVNQAMHLHSLIAQHRLLADATHGMVQAFQGSLKMEGSLPVPNFFSAVLLGVRISSLKITLARYLKCLVITLITHGIWAFFFKTENSRLLHLKIIQLENPETHLSLSNPRTPFWGFKMVEFLAVEFLRIE